MGYTCSEKEVTMEKGNEQSMKGVTVKTDDIWCVIPVYNNHATVQRVARECRKYLRNVVVVDDGSTDVDVRSLFSEGDITVLTHEKNVGKGKAVLTALKYIKNNLGRYMITIDADGQHYPGDIEKFIPLLTKENDSIVVGLRRFDETCAPKRSRIGNEVANFWMKIETGVSLSDCQSGFRAYPVDHISKIKFAGSRYEFETEVLARASWAGIDIKSVSVGVKYPKPEERVSHFDLKKDNLRIGLMHARLVGRRLLPLPHKRLLPQKETIKYVDLLRHPVKALKEMLKENATPAGLAAAAAMGIFLGVLPILSFHMPVILYFAVRLHLNKVMALSIQNICMPPLMPIACIELGHYMLYGTWITEASLRVVLWQLKDRVFEWFIGSLVIAPIAAIIAAIIVYIAAKRIKEREEAKALG
jgi:glycosyltransferase involved in cell wall biosynthesis